MLKPVLLVLLALTAAPAAGPSTANAKAAGDQFAGSTPCGEEARRFLGITNAACEQITWDLALAPDAASGRPFELRARYHMPIPGSPNHLDRGIELQLSGVWTSAAGDGAHRGRTLYTLTTGERSLRLALIEGGLLQLLTAERRLMVGNAGWSYTLNRRDVSAARAPRHMTPLDAGAGPEVPDYRGLAGEFEGRTPCQEISKVLDLAVDAGCTKLKWGLKLLQDPATGRPTTYQLGGTVYRDGELQRATPRTGKWSVLRDTSRGALIYRLERDEPGGSLLLMRADENVLFFLDKEGNALVGNRSFSYTLNRADSRD